MTNITLTEALDTFSENIDEIQVAAETNMKARFTDYKKPRPMGNYNLFWVKANLYLMGLEKATVPLKNTLRHIRVRKQPKSIDSITDSDILRAKETPIESILPSEVRRGYACCPLHHEKTPSFHIRKDNTFMCFGCQEYGDVIDLYQKLNNCSFIDAVKALK